MHISHLYIKFISWLAFQKNFLLNYFHLAKEATKMAFVLHFTVALKDIPQDILPNIFKEHFLPPHICSSCLHCTSINRSVVKNWKNNPFKLPIHLTLACSHSWAGVSPFPLPGHQMWEKEAKGNQLCIRWIAVPKTDFSFVLLKHLLGENELKQLLLTCKSKNKLKNSSGKTKKVIIMCQAFRLINW